MTDWPGEPGARLLTDEEVARACDESLARSQARREPQPLRLRTAAVLLIILALVAVVAALALDHLYGI